MRDAIGLHKAGISIAMYAGLHLEKKEIPVTVGAGGSYSLGG